MADFMLLGLFDNIDTTADVVDEMRESGVDDKQVTIMSNVPYASKFFGRKPARLWFLPFALGGAATGALIAFFIAFVTPDIYPIHVGGQELTPVPPTAIMFFEFISLFTMLGAFVGFLIQNRYPILVRQIYDERITEGYIGVAVAATAAQHEPVVAIFEKHGAKVIKREDGSAYKPQGIRHLLFWGGIGTAGLVAILAPLLLSFDIVRVPWVNTMSDTVSVRAQEGPRRAAPAEAIPIQGPVLIAGEPASEPLPATDRSIARGRALYGINCAFCHGTDGSLSDGAVGLYFDEIPALNDGNVRNLTDAEIFLIITNGKNRMPSLAENLSPGDTWDVVNYIRTLSTTPDNAGQ